MVKPISVLAFSIALVYIGLSSVSASEPAAIAWKDLVPAKVLEDPFRELSDEQLQDLSYVVRVRTLIAQNKISLSAPDVAEASEAQQSLKKQGIDIGWLLSQRGRVRQLRAEQAIAVEPSLNGRHVTLAGYVIPVQSTKGRLTEFLLVPTVDACSHATPPPPNQIVNIRFRDGVKVDRLKPVVVTGLMKTQSTTRKLLRGNGPTEVTAAYAISAEEIGAYISLK